MRSTAQKRTVAKTLFIALWNEEVGGDAGVLRCRTIGRLVFETKLEDVTNEEIRSKNRI